MVKYLLDTNIIIDHLRGRNLIGDKIIEKGCAISVITLAELLYGAHKSDDPQQSLFATYDLLESFGFHIEVISEAAAQEFAEMKAVLEKAGQRLEDFDLLIAATAKVSGLILVTKNTKHFERVEGLKLFQWKK